MVEFAFVSGVCAESTTTFDPLDFSFPSTFGLVSLTGTLNHISSTKDSKIEVASEYIQHLFASCCTVGPHSKVVTPIALLCISSVSHPKSESLRQLTIVNISKKKYKLKNDHFIVSKKGNIGRRSGFSALLIALLAFTKQGYHFRSRKYLLPVPTSRQPHRLEALQYTS